MDTFKLPPKLLTITTGGIKRVTGYYVYSITVNGELLFIGSGTKRRAWNLSPEIEDAKRLAKAFEITIIKDYLTRNESLELKRQLVVLHNPPMNYRK
jgi:hypothetical protein